MVRELTWLRKDGCIPLHFHIYCNVVVVKYPLPLYPYLGANQNGGKTGMLHALLTPLPIQLPIRLFALPTPPPPPPPVPPTPKRQSCLIMKWPIILEMILRPAWRKWGCSWRMIPEVVVWDAPATGERVGLLLVLLISLLYVVRMMDAPIKSSTTRWGGRPVGFGRSRINVVDGHAMYLYVIICCVPSLAEAKGDIVSFDKMAAKQPNDPAVDNNEQWEREAQFYVVSLMWMNSRRIGEF